MVILLLDIMEKKIMIGDIFNARLTKVNILNGEVVFSKRY